MVNVFCVGSTALTTPSAHVPSVGCAPSPAHTALTPLLPTTCGSIANWTATFMPGLASDSAARLPSTYTGATSLTASSIIRAANGAWLSTDGPRATTVTALEASLETST